MEIFWISIALQCLLVLVTILNPKREHCEFCVTCRREAVQMRVRGLRPALREQLRPQEAHARSHERQALLLPRERLREELHTPEFPPEAHASPLRQRRGRRLVPPVALRLPTVLAGARARNRSRTRTGAARSARGRPSDSDSGPNPIAAAVTALETRPQAQTRASLEPRAALAEHAAAAAAAAQQQQRAAQLSGRLLHRLPQRRLGLDARPDESELCQFGLRLSPVRRALRRQQGVQSRPDRRGAQQLVLSIAAAAGRRSGRSVDGSGGEERSHEPRAPEHGALAARRRWRLRVGGRRHAAVPPAGGPRRAAAAQELLSRSALRLTGGFGKVLERKRRERKLCALLVFVCATGSHTLKCTLYEYEQPLSSFNFHSQSIADQ